MKTRTMLVMLSMFVLLLSSIPAYAGVMIVASTPTYDGSAAMEQNLDRAISALNGKVIAKGEPFSFNEIVGPRAEDNGFTTAPNGNGVAVPGGGVSQVATTLNATLKDLAGEISYEELHAFGGAFSAGYVERAADAVLTDYARGLDFRFTSNHAENLSISMWRAGGTVFCQLTGIGAATSAPVATPEPEATQTPNSSAEPTDNSEPEHTLYVVNVNSYVNLRGEPSTGADSLAQIPKGASVEFTGEREGDFLRVMYEGKTGFVHGDYLSPADPNAEMLEVINCKTSVTLREGPSTKTGKLAAIPLGEKVKYLGATEDGFRKVEYEGKTGYVMANYLTEPEQ